MQVGPSDESMQTMREHEQHKSCGQLRSEVELLKDQIKRESKCSARLRAERAGWDVARDILGALT